ncbi:MAG: ABC transporter ATP-binding protein [Spirochaetaceae bacterium]|jgi:peptide/nickel transport system permease protein|nr:ABC transporter ATP-binding protein [Spirochaetaceae bacterium]
MPDPTLLALRNLHVSFRILRGEELFTIQAVRNLSFSLGRGEILGIVGESGSGKSVTTQAIPALLPANAEVSGAIYYEGRDLLKMEAAELRSYRGRKIGMIFQEPGRSYDPLQSMERVFLETLRCGDPAISRKDASEKAARLLEEAGLDNGRERLLNFPHQFSGGQLQRIGIALALAQDCELLIADEPTTALDVTIQKQIVDLLKSLRRKRNISIIFISHDIDLVADISDRILVMYGGLIMEAGPSELIASAPRHPYTAALLRASPRLGSHYSRERLVPIPGPAPGSPVTGRDSGEGCPFAPRCAEAGEDCALNLPAPSAPEGAAEGVEIRCLHRGGEPWR